MAKTRLESRQKQLADLIHRKDRASALLRATRDPGARELRQFEVERLNGKIEALRAVADQDAAISTEIEEAHARRTGAITEALNTEAS